MVAVPARGGAGARPTLPIAEAPSADLRMLAVAALATLATGLGFGLVPALANRPRLAGRRPARRRAACSAAGTTERLRSAFVIAEVAAAVVLLVAVGLFLRALWRVQDVDPGFRAEGVLTARTALPLPKYEATAMRRAVLRRVCSTT